MTKVTSTTRKTDFLGNEIGFTELQKNIFTRKRGRGIEVVVIAEDGTVTHVTIAN